MASALRLHPLLVIFGLLAGGELYGIAGVLVALPTMAGLPRDLGLLQAARRARALGRGKPERPRRGRARTAAGRIARGLGSAACGTRSRTRPPRESPLWEEALLPDDERRPLPVFSPLAPEELGSGVETIYEGYLVHYGEPRLFAPPDEDTALLLGDYLYAHGLVRVARTGNAAAVADLAELISLCAQARAEGRDGDGAAWAATAVAARAGRSRRRRATSSGCEATRAALEALAREAAGDDAGRARRSPRTPASSGRVAPR